MMKHGTQFDPSAETPVSKKPGALPELLAPAGDWECARAAVENGADAIYFGLGSFNARMRARNFTETDLPQLMSFLHRRGVKGYTTFNTLVFSNELLDAERQLRSIIEAGVDAVIVQDVGICRLIRKLSPDFPIHASTQMTITSVSGVRFARDLGCGLVVLARECSITEIGKIHSAISGTGSGNDQSAIPLEVFVHGALCVAYSGQCLTSEALGGRSANRGECAQACRMPYELIRDGETVPLGDRRYLLSPQDLAGLELLPELVRAGVASLKIEGRLKSPDYVANITRVYRRALDQLEIRSGNEGAMESPCGTDESERAIAVEESRYDMEMAFSRGLHTGWLDGINNQELVHARFGKKRGVYLGRVSGVGVGEIVLALEGPLKPGDGVVFDSGQPETKEEGGRVYEVSPLPRTAMEGSEVIVRFGRDDVDFSRVHVTDRVWKTSDPQLDRSLRASFEKGVPRYRRPVRMEVSGNLGSPLRLRTRDRAGNEVEVFSDVPLTKAVNHPLTTDILREQLGRLGGTPFYLDELVNRLETGLMLPLSEMNRARRGAVTQLDALRAAPRQWTLHPDTRRTDTAHRMIDVPTHNASQSHGSPPRPRRTNPAKPELVVLVRSMEQLDAVLESDIQTVYCEFEDPRKYREGVRRVRCASERKSFRVEVFVAPPRIFKPGEDWVLGLVRTSDADGCLARNPDHLSSFHDSRLIGDFSLNVANELAAEYFIGRHGLERLTASYDLNIAQLEALLRAAPPEWFEITIHQHMPMFHMEHCVFCAFLSSGTDYTNCGRPCDRHEVSLKDRAGVEHPLKADAGCRNTVFSGMAQTGAEHIERLIQLGARRFRIEFLRERPAEVNRTLGLYQRLLRGEIDGARLWRELKAVNQLGVTRGTMTARPRE